MASPTKDGANTPNRTNKSPSHTRGPSDSSRMTDELTDYGDNNDSQRPKTNQSPQTGPRLDSRPSTAQSRGNWSNATPHHRFGPTSYAGSTGAPSTRPPTSSSRTHVPTLAASAFYRPMSSQKLQAQRSMRKESPTTQTPLGGGRGTPDLAEEPPSRSGRKNVRPLSRGTDITEAENDEDIPDVPALPKALASRDGSESGLRHFERAYDPNNLTVPSEHDAPPVPKKNSGFFKNTLLPIRSNRTSLVGSGRHGHEKLPSDASTPNITDETKAAVQRELEFGNEKNYQFFPGNTVFCLGGRLQNTKDRPINLFTATVIILPMILFYAGW
jgi:palmitoyltransferase ZDHHC9/14/18